METSSTLYIFWQNVIYKCKLFGHRSIHHDIQELSSEQHKVVRLQKDHKSLFCCVDELPMLAIIKRKFKYEAFVIKIINTRIIDWLAHIYSHKGKQNQKSDKPTHNFQDLFYFFTRQISSNSSQLILCNVWYWIVFYTKL